MSNRVKPCSSLVDWLVFFFKKSMANLYFIWQYCCCFVTTAAVVGSKLADDFVLPNVKWSSKFFPPDSAWSQEESRNNHILACAQSQNTNVVMHEECEKITKLSYFKARQDRILVHQWFDEQLVQMFAFTVQQLTSSTWRQSPPCLNKVKCLCWPSGKSSSTAVLRS